MSNLDALGEALPSNVRAQEPSRKRIPRAVRIHDQLTRERRHLEHPGFPWSRPVNQNRRFGALGDHDDARTLRVGLGVRRDALGDLCNVCRVRFEHGLGVLLRFRLVPDDDVGVGEDLLQLGGEELGDERRGEVEDERLRVVGSGISISLACEIVGRKGGRGSLRTLLFSDACLLSASTDSTPCERKNPST